jgi:hypothetical protein
MKILLGKNSHESFDEKKKSYEMMELGGIHEIASIMNLICKYSYSRKGKGYIYDFLDPQDSKIGIPK